jgi:hypothetical protein
MRAETTEVSRLGLINTSLNIILEFQNLRVSECLHNCD